MVSIKSSINKGLSDMLNIEFKHAEPVNRPLISTQIVPNPYWIAGFVSREGWFDIRIIKTSSKLGHRVKLRFRITQHIRDFHLMERITHVLGLCNIYKYPNQPAV